MTSIHSYTCHKLGIDVLGSLSTDLLSYHTAMRAAVTQAEMYFTSISPPICTQAYYFNTPVAHAHMNTRLDILSGRKTLS